MEVDNSYTQLVLIGDKRSNLISSNKVWDSKVIIVETDTGMTKKGDGIRPYRELRYFSKNTISDELLNIISNANNKNGVVVLDNTGHIPDELMPTDTIVSGNIVKFISGDAVAATAMYKEYMKNR